MTGPELGTFLGTHDWLISTLSRAFCHIQPLGQALAETAAHPEHARLL